ncbi:MAG: histidinol-phosphate transaminase [Woeseiaceae bacterium]
MSIARLARDGIRELEPYKAAVQVDDTTRLNANEASWRNSGDSFRRPLNRYPEIRPAGLGALLANRYGCSPEQLLVTRGTSEAIDLLIRVFCQAGRDSLVTTSPTFSMYEHYAVVQDAEVREVQTSPDSDFAVEPERILQACDNTTKLVFLCSPNNPTGTLVPGTVLRNILESRAGKSAVVVDEAYIEFAGADSAVSLLEEFDNLVVLRTLSKALAYAGARCGSVIASTDVVRMLDAVQAPYALATPVIECVENALREQIVDETDRHIAQTIAERERVSNRLAQFSFVRRVWPSAANFILVEVDGARELMRQSEDDKVLLRYFGDPLADCVRITIGSPAENDRMLDSLQRMEAANA